jgi:hypothetical protein
LKRIIKNLTKFVQILGILNVTLKPNFVEKYLRIKVYNAVPLTQYCAGGKIKKNEMGWACGAYGGVEGRGVHRVLVGKPEGKRPLGRPRRRW